VSGRAQLAAACLALALLTPSPARAEAVGDPVDFSNPRHIEVAFLQGLRLLEGDAPREAAIVFRRILAENPNLPRVRLELARALFQMRSWRESRAEFVAVLSGDVPDQVKQNILKFINAIDARRGFDWNAAVGLSLGPEAGRRYKTDTVNLDFFGVILPFTVDREENDSFGVSFEGSAEMRRELFSFGGGPSVVGFVSGAADIFDAAGARSDDFAFSSAAGARLVWRQTTANIAANAGVRHQRGDIYDDRIGLSGAVEYRSDTGFAPSASASYAAVNVHDASAQDGDLWGIGAGFSKSIFGSASIGAYASAERFDAAEADESYDALKLSLVGSADIGAGYNATAQASYRHSEYQARMPLFLDTRIDDQFDLDVEIVKKDLYVLDNFSPFVRLGYTRNESSIGVYSYDEYRFLIGLKNAF
jgi:hypothetical protein